MIEDPAKVGHIVAAGGSAVRQDLEGTGAGSGPATAARRVRPYAIMILVLRAIFAAVTIAVICLGGYYLSERNQAREASAVESTDASVESLRDMRKQARAASKLAVAEGCTGLSADYEVWEDYLDKKARRKLKALIAKCNNEGEAQVGAEQ